MKRARRQQGKGAFDLIEAATHLLRTVPLATLATYYLGAVPFMLGLLYFWADMSRSPFAHQHLAEAALGLGALFLWMKFWQAVFARRMRAHLAGEPPPAMKLRRAANMLVTQTILQPLGLFFLPGALLPIIPFAWVYAVFQNVTALAEGDHSDATKLLKQSWQQAKLWPRQNWFMLAVMLAFTVCVFLNWATAGLMLPALIKMLFGVESVFSKSPYALLNTTFFAGMFSLTYLSVDPILKTIYALRCFYGESLQSGDDLKAELKPFGLASPKLAATLLILLAILSVSGANAESLIPTATPLAKQTIAPPELDRAINQTIHEQKYTWRMPREKMVEADANEGVLAKFLEKAGSLIRRCVRATIDWLEHWLRKFFDRQPKDSSGNGGSGYGWIMAAEVLLYALVAAALVALAIFLYRVWRGRQKKVAAVAEAILPVPDLADENVHADQLPEDGWTQLARELLERGEFRLAMRAFYLASLAHLAARNLISIARFKSNRDYERELRRRAHAFPNLLATFGDNLFDFERTWYGRHEANRDLVSQFATNVDKIKSAA